MSAPNYDSQGIEKAPRPLWTVIKVMAFLGVALIVTALLISSFSNGKKTSSVRTGSVAGEALAASKNDAVSACKNARSMNAKSDGNISIAEGDAVILEILPDKRVGISPSKTLITVLPNGDTYTSGPEGRRALDGKKLKSGDTNTASGCLYAIEDTVVKVDYLN